MINVGEITPEGMTLAELRDWLARCDIAEIPPETKPTVRISIRGTIKRVEATA